MVWGGCLVGMGRLTLWCGDTLDSVVMLSGKWEDCLDSVGRLSEVSGEAVWMV